MLTIDECIEARFAACHVPYKGISSRPEHRGKRIVFLTYESANIRGIRRRLWPTQCPTMLAYPTDTNKKCAAV